MTPASQLPLVSTIGERCRVCYQCVRECPAKAIRIADHRAQVIPERCIGCGVCYKVCTQDAKKILSAVDAVEALLDGPVPVAAILAPSFPAEFIRYDYTQVVGALRALGFAAVHEVAFGAELVARQYQQLVAEDADRLWIATTCPSVAGYVRRYHPGLTPSLAPIVSPMIAMARLLREQRGAGVRIVFIGPCIAKKREALSPELGAEVDEVLTFAELRELLTARAVDLEAVAPCDFDAPHARGGGLFPLSGGMLQVAGIHEDLVTGQVMVGEGPAEFSQAIKEAETGLLETRLLEILFCKGCTMGPGMSSDLPHFGRRARVSQFVRHRIASVDAAEWEGHHRTWAGLDMSRAFTPFDLRLPIPSPEELGRILDSLGKHDPHQELNCGACGYGSCRDLASAIYVGLAEPTMCLPFSIEQLRSTVRELARSNDELATAQEALVRSEKLASMGQLAAGIAHEVNNPLGVVIMYAHFLMEQLGERPEYRDDLVMVVEQADRCKKIVAGLLDFARQNKVEHDRVHLPELVHKALRGVPPPVNVVVDVAGRHGGSGGGGRSGSADPGPDQPRHERLRGDAGRRQPAGRDPRRRWPGGAGGHRHRRRDPARALPEAVRAVLHDEEGRQGDRARVGRHLRHREDAPGRHQGDLEHRSRQGAGRHPLHGVAAAAAPGRRRRGRARWPGHGDGADRALRGCAVETLRVLVVDDETGMRLAVSRVLSTYAVRLGDAGEQSITFQVEGAESGEAALEKMAVSVPDILLLDMKMPGMSGLDVLQEVRNRRYETLTVMITAYATLEMAIEATKRGAHDVLPKPFTPDDLRVALRRAVRHYLVQREARRLAEEKRQVRFQFITVLGHELKAPLAAVEGFLRVLQDGTAGHDPAAIARVIDRALVRTEGMRKLIVDLLNLTRIESGQKRRDLADVDLREVALASHRDGRGGGGRPGHPHRAARPRARAARGRSQRTRNHPQQPRQQRGQVQPRRRARGRDDRAPRRRGPGGASASRTPASASRPRMRRASSRSSCESRTRTRGAFRAPASASPSSSGSRNSTAGMPRSRASAAWAARSP